MKIKYNVNINNSAIENNLKKLINQTYKLLPMREENVDWQSPLGTIIEELSGMDRLLVSYNTIFFSILCKLEGLYTLTDEKDFFLYRRIIFECLGLLGKVQKLCQQVD